MSAVGRGVDRRLGWILLLLLAVALFFRLYRLAEVPPGIHYDEIINAEIAAQAQQEGLQLVYDAGGGREGLYYALVATALRLPLPISWRLRLPAVFCSMLGLLLTFGWVRRSFGPWAAVTATGGMAVALWAVLLGRSVLRAVTLLPLAAAAAWLLLAAVRSRRLSWAQTIALALVLGLLPYSYRAARVLPVAYGLFLVYLLIWHRPLPRRLWWALGGALLLAAPFFYLLLTQPVLDARVDQLSGPWRALLAGDPRPVAQATVATLGMFGWKGDAQVHYNLPLRPIFEPVGLLLFVAGIGLALRRWRQPPYAFVLLWLAVGLAPGFLTEPAPNFVHTVAAQGAVFVFPGIAVAGLAQRWSARRRAVAVLLALWLVANGAWTFRDTFLRWPALEAVQNYHQYPLAVIARDLDESESALPVAICRSQLNEQDSWWRSGRQTMPFLLDRDDLAIRWYNCASAQVWPHGGRATRYYFSGDETFAPWLPPALQTPEATTRLAAGVRMERLAVAPALEIQVQTLAQPAGKETPVNFADTLSFLGYKLDPPSPAPGTTAELYTYWRVTVPLPADVAIFVHLLDEEGTLVSQGDALTLLSDTLQPDDVFAQRHTLPFPADLPGGAYVLSVGVYARNGAFPPLQLVAGGAAQGERLTLTTLSFSP